MGSIDGFGPVKASVSHSEAPPVEETALSSEMYVPGASMNLYYRESLISQA